MDNVMRAVARESGIHYVEIRNGPPGEGDRPAPSLLSADRFHPNGAGYRFHLLVADLAHRPNRNDQAQTEQLRFIVKCIKRVADGDEWRFRFIRR